MQMARRVAGSPGHFLGLSHQRLWTLGTFHPAVRGIGQQRFASEFDAQLDIDLATDLADLARTPEECSNRLQQLWCSFQVANPRISTNAAVSACEKQGWSGALSLSLSWYEFCVQNINNPVHRSVVPGYADVDCNTLARFAGVYHCHSNNSMSTVFVLMQDTS